MKIKGTTSAEKAVVAVFLATLPLGIMLGFAFDKPEDRVETKYEVRTVMTEDYTPPAHPSGAVTSPACTDAWDATQDVIENLEGHDVAVSKLTRILNSLYPATLGTMDDSVGELNRLKGEIEQHKYNDWTRLSADQIRIDRLEATMRACVGVEEGE